MENIYYHGKGRYQADYNRLVDLMPISGQSETVAGELIRAVSKLILICLIIELES